MKVELKIFAISVITIAVAIDTTKAAKFLADKPDFLTPCIFADRNFNECFSKNIQVIYSEWKDGIPGYKALGRLDPLYVKRIVISQDSNSNLALNSELNNLVITGVSGMIVKEARFNAKTLVSKLKLIVPKFRIDCDYKVNGRILNLVLNSSGKSEFEFENVVMVLNLKLKLRDEGGYTFTDIEKTKLDVTNIGNFHVHLENLFNGQKDLEDSTNALFNENWRDFYEVLGPAITKAVEELMKDRMTKAYAYVPANFFVRDIPSAAEYYA